MPALFFRSPKNDDVRLFVLLSAVPVAGISLNWSIFE